MAPSSVWKTFYVLQEALIHVLFAAGGFDPRLPECSVYFQRLVHLAKQLSFRIIDSEKIHGAGVNGTGHEEKSRRHILFLKNVSLPLKLFLLKKSACILYTPTDEHFGIVRSATYIVLCCLHGRWVITLQHIPSV